ncbi:MAG TPA: carbohydrate binding family 9 domain-containing protein, partial [Vicinamibacteria bacterium]
MRLSLILAAILFASPLHPQETTRRQARATRVEAAPTIDGIVDEEIWSRAEVITDFVQAEPHEGEPATEKTEVRILYDESTFYVGAICFDSDPSGIVVTDSRRDSPLLDTDSFQMIFDTYLDRQNGFVFGTNPAGIEYDGQVSNEGEGGGQTSTRQSAQAVVGSGFNLNWDASFTVKTHQNEVGWMAEFAIPLRSLRYGGKPQNWGLNFKRSIRRKR